jgi:hypothetical protein
MDWVIDQFRLYLKGRIVEVGFGHGHYSEMFSKFGDYWEWITIAIASNRPARRCPAAPGLFAVMLTETTKFFHASSRS